MNTVDTTFAALADGNRRQVLQLLSQGPYAASEIASEVGLARNAMSRHLNLLREAGLIDVALSETDGRSRIYTLRGEELSHLRHWLDELETQWREQLSSFRRFVENNKESDTDE